MMDYNSVFGISLNDYQDGAVFSGENSMGELAELQKAMEAGDITGMQTVGRTDVPGATLKVEDLENTLKVLTFKETDIKLWKKVRKLPAFNTVEEYNQQLEYGTDGYSFTDEGGLPEDDSPMYRRQAQLVKFMGTTRSVSHPMQLVSTMVGDLMNQEIKNGTMKILRDADRSLWFANSHIVSQEFNGYRQQQIDSLGGVNSWSNSDVVIDLRGQKLDEATFENGALSIINNNGEADLFMCPPQVLSAFKNSLLDQKKIYIGNNTEGNMPNAGLQVQKYLSQFGFIDLEFDKFLAQSNRHKTITSPATSKKAPSKPTLDNADSAKMAVDKNNTLFAGDQAGSYSYAVSAINRYGESQLVALGSAPIAVTTAQSVDLKFTASDDASGFIIYRSKKDDKSGKFYPIFKISIKELTDGYDGGAAGVVRDKNRSIAGCEESFLIDSSEDVWSFKQLAPLMKMDLAVLSPATRFMLLLYGTPILYAPKKMVTFKNIGIDV